MHVAKIVRPYKDREYAYWFLRQTYREDGKVKHRTLANLSALPPEVIELVARALKGERFVGAGEALRTVRTLPHGHVAAVLGLARRLGLPGILDRRPSRSRDLALALVAARVLGPASKLATAGWLADSTLARRLGVEGADENELYGAMDWLLARQARVEASLARRHLAPGALVLYDLTGTYVEGSYCPLARHGHSRDHRPDRPQIEFGLLTDARGCPVAVEAFPGNTADPATVETQIEKLRIRFGLAEIVLVGDRGMLTSARIERLRETGGIGWVSCLRAPAIRRLVEAGDLQLGLFDERNLAEITSPRVPGRAPRRVPQPGARGRAGPQARGAPRGDRGGAREGGRERGAWQAADRRCDRPARGAGGRREEDGQARRARHRRRPLRVRRREREIADEAALDGLYVVRTSVGPERLDAPAIVETYKRLACGRARLPGAQGRRPRGPADLPLEGGPGAGASVPVLPRGLRALAPRGRLGAAPVPGRGAPSADRSGRAARRSSGALAKERDHADARRAAGGQFRSAAGASRHAHRAPGRSRPGSTSGLASGSRTSPPRSRRERSSSSASRRHPCSQSAAAQSAGSVLRDARRALEVRPRA